MSRRNTKVNCPVTCLARLAYVLMLIACTAAPLHAQENDEEEPLSPVHITKGPTGLVVLTVAAETQQRIQLTAQPAEAATFQSQATGYGRLEADPAESFTVRAPIMGVLHGPDEGPWPAIGDRAGPDTVVGYVQPRFTPSELLDLKAKWMDAQAEADEVRAELDAARASFENKRSLNANGKLVSDRAVEEAKARLASDEARLAAATKRVDMLKNVLSSGPQNDARFPLDVSQGGEVTTVLARPGEVVDAGQPLLELARYHTLIARVALPAGTAVESSTSKACVLLVGGDGTPLTTDPVGAAPQADPVTMGPTLLYRVTTPPDDPLRPGAAIMAYVPLSGEPVHGTIIPRSAVLRFAGHTWIYVKTADDRFERRDVPLHSPAADGWYVTSGVSAGEQVVSGGAQLLLSEELKAQIESEAEAEE